MKLTESFCQASSLWFPYTVFLTSVNFLFSDSKNYGFFFLQTCKMLIDGLESYCHVFMSRLDSHSDGTHSLQRNLWGSIVMQFFSKFVLMKKQTHLHFGWLEGEYIFSVQNVLYTLQVYSTPLFYLRFQYHRNHCALTTREDLIWTPQYLNCISCTETGYF